MSAPHAPSAPPSAGRVAALTFGALGVVFGDIGTSPLYTLRECLHAHEGVLPSPDDVYGVLSLVSWALTLVVTVKYLAFVMRADNHGEGGIFALLAILPAHQRTQRGALPRAVALMVVVGAALLYGDGAITPAISVLSAVEGIALGRPDFEPAVVPVTCAILLGLFVIQHRGTGTVGKLFGPIMTLWFLVIGSLGAWHIARAPGVLRALSPHYAFRFVTHHGVHGFLVLGSVVLAVTGAEALYADMGHFGRRPIRLAWLALVMPALLLCYFGQGALLLRDPRALTHPFFALVPDGHWTLALVVLSSLATVIASQALISGVFSLTRQAMQLGYFPRVTVRHTDADTEGQIYVPQLNWLLAVTCVALVLGFRRSDRLASAYGIAVTGTMVLTSLAFFAVMRQSWEWPRWRAVAVLALFLSIDLPFFGANLFKLRDGGYVPVAIGLVFIAAMLLWSRGRTLTVEQYAARLPPNAGALPLLRSMGVTRVPGVGVFMASSDRHAPPILLHVAERTHALPATLVLMTVLTEGTPQHPPGERFDFAELGDGIYQLVVRYGFMEHPDVPAVLAEATTRGGVSIDPTEVTYYLGRENVLGGPGGRMGRVAENLFALLQRNSVKADRHFGIPPLQVMEVGIQIDL